MLELLPELLNFWDLYKALVLSLPISSAEVSDEHFRLSVGSIDGEATRPAN